MKYKFILLTFLTGLLSSSAFCMERDIYPPNVENYDGKSSIGVWRLKEADRYEKKGIPPGEPLYPYHAWIKYEDKNNFPLHCIFYTADTKPKLVSFVCDKDMNGTPIDPRQYHFERTTEIKYLIKAPYIDDKTDIITGEKFDVWNLQETLGSKKDQKKHWDPRPDNVPVNSFPAVFKFHGDTRK